MYFFLFFSHPQNHYFFISCKRANLDEFGVDVVGWREAVGGDVVGWREEVDVEEGGEEGRATGVGTEGRGYTRLSARITTSWDS